MTVALLVQMFIDVFPLLDISIVLFSLSMFSLILEIMCSGTLTIAPRDGSGTVVTVTVPDNARRVVPMNR